MQLKQRQKIIGAVTLLAFLSFFLPTYFAHAGNGWFGIPDGTDIITYILQNVFIGINGLTAVTANALSMAVVVRAGGSIPVVATTWKILRDFSNMFFIIMLIYMAFATIFDHGKYTFKDMIVRFAIVAILINFSLVIGNMVIDASQVLANIFLGSIGNVGNRIGSLLNPSVLFNGGTTGTGAGSISAASITSLLFAIILALIFLFSLLVATVFSIVRIPIIWGLLIVSPIAWMSHILPGTNKWWSKWWHMFFGWNLFLPVYLFFMYLGLLFLAQRDQIIGAVIQANSASGVNPGNTGLLNGLNTNLSFNLLFFYLFAAFVMVGGTWAAKETTSLFGEGFDKGLGWAKWAVKNFPTPYVGSLTNWQEAAKQRGEQFKREGVLGYFGTEKSDRQTAKIAGGVFGVREAKDKQLGSDVGTWKSRFANLDTNQLRQQMDSGPIHQQLATRELLKERNQLSDQEQVDTYNLYNKTSPASAVKFANSINYNNLSDIQRDAWYGRVENTELRKKIVTSKAEKGDYTTHDQVLNASTLFTSASDRAVFLRKAAKRMDKDEAKKIITEMPTVLGRASIQEEQIAINEVLADKQALSGADIMGAYNNLGAGSEEGEKFLSKIKFPTLKPTDRRELFDLRPQISDIETKHKLFDAMAEKGELEIPELEEAALTYGGSERKEFLTKAQKERFVRTAEVRARIRLGLPPGTPTPAGEVDTEILGQISKMKAEDIAGLSADPGPTGTGAGVDAWLNPDFRRILHDHLIALETRQGPEGAALLNPALPFDATTNPVVAPGKIGRGTEFKREIVKATRDGTKLGHINTMVGIPPGVPVPP